jgi:glycosyltransferase involved in cell wall biosynthesis
MSKPQLSDLAQLEQVPREVGRMTNGGAMPSRSHRATRMRVALLTGGDDRPYALGMTSALAREGVYVDFIGSDKLDAPELHNSPQINFLNLRGDQNEDAPLLRKVVRILTYYARLATYVPRSRAQIFHLLWNNKFEHFDRTALMLYYRLFRKPVVFTAHNVNARKRDGRDSWFNRFTLRIQYRLCSHILVHTTAMERELLADFGIAPERVSVIPFGINDTNQNTDLDRIGARTKLGLAPMEKILLFFGQIAPYKGLEFLVDALVRLIQTLPDVKLVIAGKVKKGFEEYWKSIQTEIFRLGLQDRVIARIQHIPDDDVEIYFKAADVLALPYVRIFQSGVPFLAYNFGLPVIATDVGSLREDVIEGATGMICRPRSAADLAEAVMVYFRSDLFQQLEWRRTMIREFARQRYSWAKVAAITMAAYSQLLDEKTTMHYPVRRIVD